MDFKELAEVRYSCRSISDRKVDPQLIEQIIETAMKAPTAVNRQPLKIFRMESEQAKKDVARATRFTFGADNFLVVGYKKDEAWERSYDHRNFADVDASIVATHIMLQITDLGLATTWVGHFDAPLLRSLYPAMADYELIALFPIGYAVEDDKPSPRHFARKSREEIVETL